MLSKSFCVGSTAREETKERDLSRVLDSQPLTPGVLHKPLHKNQAKEFMQLYLKAKSHQAIPRVQSEMHIFPRSNTNHAKNNRSDFQGDDAFPMFSLTPKGDVFGKMVSLPYVDQTNNPISYKTDKPSHFKRNFESMNEIKNVEERNPEPASNLQEIIEIRQDEQQQQTRPSREIRLIEAEAEAVDHEHHRQGGQNQRNLELESQLPSSITQPLGVSNQLSEMAVQTNDSQSLVFDSNVKGTFKELLKIYILSLLIYVVLLGLYLDVYPYHIVFGFLWVIEAFLIYGIWKHRVATEHAVQRKRKLSMLLQLASLMIFELCGMLRIEGVSFKLTIALVPTLLTTIFSCYITSSRNNQGTYLIEPILHALISLQLLTVSLKTDSIIHWNWPAVFWASWAFLIVMLFYCFGLFMILLFFLCFETSALRRTYHLIGLIWVVLTFSGYSCTIFGVLYGFSNDIQYGLDQDWIFWSLIGGILHISFLIMMSLSAHNQIKKFIRYIITTDARAQERKAQKDFKFEKDQENLPPYIVRFTPSYFLTFKESLKVKNEAKLKDMKKKVTLAKLSQIRSNIPEVNYKMLRPKKAQPYYSDLISKKVSSDGSTYGVGGDYIPLVGDMPQSDVHNESPVKAEEEKPKNRRIAIKVEPILIPKNNRISNNKRVQELNSKIQENKGEICSAVHANKNMKEDTSMQEARHQKLCFSVDDIGFVKQFENEATGEQTPSLFHRKANSEKDEEKICIICFDRFPDAVIMDCGHGGICYDCALESWKKSKECFMCRRPITKILHIDTGKMERVNIRRVLSATKLVKEEPKTPGSENGEIFSNNMYIAAAHV